jgi:hypothetical protein
VFAQRRLFVSVTDELAGRQREQYSTCDRSRRIAASAERPSREIGSMNDDAAAKRARIVYIVQRARALQAEINGLRLERPNVIAALRSEGRDPKSAETKTLKHRRIYATTRQAEARAELEGLKAERPAPRAA